MTEAEKGRGGRGAGGGRGEGGGERRIQAWGIVEVCVLE